MHKIDDKLTKVTARIQQAALAVARNPETVHLIAVSKTQPARALEAAYAWGQRRFGENYLQEALAKQAALAAYDDIEWHFIGPLQSNKTRSIAEHFAWVHAVDRLKIAQRLNDQRPPELPPLNICIQVNIDAEASKAGVSLADLPTLADAVQSLPRLRLRGLMAIPKATSDPLQQRLAFARLRQALAQLQARCAKLGQPQPFLDSLSMGMSGDLEAAIAEGATLVRVGTDIFGARQ